jgi:hypothetical protein
VVRLHGRLGRPLVSTFEKHSTSTNISPDQMCVMSIDLLRPLCEVGLVALDPIHDAPNVKTDTWPSANFCLRSSASRLFLRLSSTTCCFTAAT